jgi:hypothetical protein
MVKTHTSKTSSIWPVGCISDQMVRSGQPAEGVNPYGLELEGRTRVCGT